MLFVNAFNPLTSVSFLTTSESESTQTMNDMTFFDLTSIFYPKVIFFIDQTGIKDN